MKKSIILSIAITVTSICLLVLASAFLTAPAPACNHHLGEKFLGGFIFYIDANTCTGLIAAEKDIPSTSIKWNALDQNSTCLLSNLSLGSAIGTGAANTNAIISYFIGRTNYAAKLAHDYTPAGFPDQVWYLPSEDELDILFKNGMYVGFCGICTGPPDRSFYWSSTQSATSDKAQMIQFGTASVPGYPAGTHIGENKCSYGAGRVRPVRSF